MMKCNVGGIDRTIRVLLGLVIIGVGISFRSWWGAVGAVPILTAAIGWCPLYLPFGLSTAKKKDEGCCCGCATKPESPKA